MRTSPKYLAVLILIFFIVIQANASILFVRAGSSGDGSSWANAWGNFGSINWSSVGAGSIVCVAGGTYSDSLNTGASGVSGNAVLIKRAVTSDPSCGSSTAGWSPNFDSQVVIPLAAYAKYFKANAEHASIRVKVAQKSHKARAGHRAQRDESRPLSRRAELAARIEGNPGTAEAHIGVLWECASNLHFHPPVQTNAIAM